MSDYLANIAERILTTEPAIRPRPLSVFEPFQAMGTAGFAQQPRAEQDHRLTESDPVGAVNPAPIAMTAPGTPVDQGKTNTIAVHSPRLSPPAVMADPQPVAPTPVKRAAGQGEDRPAATHSPPEHALSIGIDVPRVERLPPVIKIKSKPLIPDHRSKVPGNISESALLKPATEKSRSREACCRSTSEAAHCYPTIAFRIDMGEKERSDGERDINSNYQRNHRTHRSACSSSAGSEPA